MCLSYLLTINNYGSVNFIIHVQITLLYSVLDVYIHVQNVCVCTLFVLYKSLIVVVCPSQFDIIQRTPSTAFKCTVKWRVLVTPFTVVSIQRALCNNCCVCDVVTTVYVRGMALPFVHMQNTL